MSEEELKNKMDTFIECYKNGMIFGAPTDIEFYEKIATLQQKVEQLENIRKEAIKYVQEKADYPISYYHCLNGLLNILNKGSDKQI